MLGWKTSSSRDRLVGLYEGRAHGTVRRYCMNRKHTYGIELVFPFHTNLRCHPILYVYMRVSMPLAGDL